MFDEDNRGAPFVLPAITITLTDVEPPETIVIPERTIPADAISPAWLAAHDAEEREPTDSKAEGQTMNDNDRDQETPDTGHEQRTGAASPEPTPSPWGSFTWGNEPWATPEEAAK